jgi:hypothetical protein
MELFVTICSLSNQGTLASLARVSKSVSCLAVSALYQKTGSRLPLTSLDRAICAALASLLEDDTDLVPVQGGLELKEVFVVCIRQEKGQYRYLHRKG